MRFGVVFVLGLTICAWGFDYKLAKGDVKDLSFYQSAPQGWQAGRVSGQSGAGM